MKKCEDHTKTNKHEGKPCIQIIAEGKCFKQECHLFSKVLKILPKLKKMREAQAKGIILTTIWDFSEKATQQRLKSKKKAEEWLSNLYPRIIKELNLGELDLE